MARLGSAASEGLASFGRGKEGVERREGKAERSVAAVCSFWEAVRAALLRRPFCRSLSRSIRMES